MKNVLIVESDDLLSEFFKISLEKKYKVDVAKDGFDAVIYYGAETHELAILNYDLPSRERVIELDDGEIVTKKLRKSGLETMIELTHMYYTIRRHEAIPYPQFILYTTKDYEDSEKSHIEAGVIQSGADSMFIKPFDRIELVMRAIKLLKE